MRDDYFREPSPSFKDYATHEAFLEAFNVWYALNYREPELLTQVGKPDPRLMPALPSTWSGEWERIRGLHWKNDARGWLLPEQRGT